jgi:hypothetical protein
MSCHRCGGFLVTELFGEMSELAHRVDMIERRCSNCGNVEGTVRANLLREIVEAVAGEKRETTTPKRRSQ